MRNGHAHLPMQGRAVKVSLGCCHSHCQRCRYLYFHINDIVIMMMIIVLIIVVLEYPCRAGAVHLAILWSEAGHLFMDKDFGQKSENCL